MTTAEDFIVASMLLYAGLRARKGNDAHTGVPIEGFVPPGEGKCNRPADRVCFGRE